MNATQRMTRITQITLIGAILAAGIVAHPADAATSTVVQLERVMVIGKRAPAANPVEVVQLPRVVVTGRRLAPTETRLADKTQRVHAAPVPAARG